MVNITVAGVSPRVGGGDVVDEARPDLPIGLGLLKLFVSRCPKGNRPVVIERVELFQTLAIKRLGPLIWTDGRTSFRPGGPRLQHRHGQFSYHWVRNEFVNVGIVRGDCDEDIDLLHPRLHSAVLKDGIEILAR